MADAQTRITDVIDPEVLAKMVLSRLPNNTILIPGVFTSSEFPIGTDGTIWEVPYNDNLGELDTFIAGTDITEQKLTQDNYKMVVIRKAAVYVADKIVKLAAYKNPMDFVAEQLSQQTIPKMYMDTQISVLEGGIPAANREDSFIAVAGLRSSQVRTAKLKLGDKASELKYILMHSAQFGVLEANNEVVYQPKNTIYPLFSTQSIGANAPTAPANMVATVAGLVIFISDNCSVVSTSPDVYAAYLLGDRAMGHYWQQNLNIDLDRVVKAKEDIISPDLDFVMCLHGMDYTSTSYTVANLENTANYTIKWNQKLITAVRLTSLIA